MEPTGRPRRRRPSDRMVVIPPRPRPTAPPFDPKLVHEAERADEFRRLVEVDGLDELEATQWLEGWEREADRVGLDRLARAFWENGGLWIRWHRSLEAERQDTPETADLGSR
jgi:hypothetical protein